MRSANVSQKKLSFAKKIEIAAITNDICTKEDAEFLTRVGSLPTERFLGMEHQPRRHPPVP